MSTLQVIRLNILIASALLHIFFLGCYQQTLVFCSIKIWIVWQHYFASTCKTSLSLWVLRSHQLWKRFVSWSPFGHVLYFDYSLVFLYTGCRRHTMGHTIHPTQFVYSCSNSLSINEKQWVWCYIELFQRYIQRTGSEQQLESQCGIGR